MNKPRKPFNLEEAKIQASILLKSLGSPDTETTHQAAKRFQRLTEFADIPIAEIPLKDIKRKHALTVIALENGFTSWAALKAQISFIVGGFLNKWFASYQEAKVEQQQQGGFLFPYKKQFFICEADYIERLGLNPNDPDWNAIGWDWANPSDKIAWQRLYKKWINRKEVKK
jgi:hypothetical protein